MLICGIVLVVTGRRVPPPVVIIRPRAELWSMLIWFGLVLLVAAITLAIGLELVNHFTNWFFLVLAPLGLLILVRRRGGSLRSTLCSVGFTRTQLKDGMILAVVMMPLMIPLLYVVGEQQRAAIQMVFHAPLGAALSFLACFIFALLTAGFVEEFFFREILQSRLAASLGSELRGLSIASLLFGMVHLPMYFFSPFEPTQGNLFWSVTGILTEQTMVGVLLGMLWIRTHNLAAPVLLHAFIDALAMMPMFRIGTG